MRPSLYDVAIVGFGPTGATLANMLGQAGIRTLVVERHREVYQLPRAVHFDGEVMRIFQSIGLTERVLPLTAVPKGLEFWTSDRQILVSVDLGEVDIGGWASDYMFHQPSLEKLLRDAALEHDSVNVRYAAMSTIEQGEESVRLVLEDGHVAEACFAVGCDGAASLVRSQCNMALEDLGFDEPWLVVDLRDPGCLPEITVQYCDPARPTTLVPGALDFYRFEFMLRPDEKDEEMQRPERVRELVAAWMDPDEAEIVRSAVYRFHAIVAREWWKDRVGIAGDAAHQTPPFLGQGMCAGIRDAANLSWKLDLVLKGGADIALLETYGSERESHVRELIDRAIGAGRLICTQDPVVAAARDEHMLAQREQAGPSDVSLPVAGPGCFQLSEHPLVGHLAPQHTVRLGTDQGRMDDLLGSGFRLVLRDAAVEPAALAPLLARGGRVAVWSDTEGDAPDGAVLVVDVDCKATAFFDAHGIHGFLVRPDNLCFGVADSSADVAGLVADFVSRTLS